MIEKAKNFKPKKFESNTKNMIKLIQDYIEDTNHISWFHKYKEAILYLFFGGCTTLINVLAFMLLRLFQIDTYISNTIAWLLAVLFAFITNKLYVFESKGKRKKEVVKECLSFFFFRILSLVFDMGIMYVMISLLHRNELLSKIVSNIFVIIINYVFSKVFIFKK